MEQVSDIGHLDMIEAMDTELQGLREQADTDAELVQLGLAVAIINHEFVAAIKGIRHKLRELGSWARANDDLLPLYQEIRTNFDHLDAHLNLFTPLQRRLQRKQTIIKGSEINHYVRTLFSVRFKRHNIELEVTQEFLDSEVPGFPSTIYPVFVNLIDNAVFWLKDIQDKPVITLDFSDNAYFISNNGPAIHIRDKEAIFEQGFSRKPGGRGLGLFISQKALRKEGMNLTIVQPGSKEGWTTFAISCSGGIDE
jgi:signal transduction histidine kinase